MSRQACSQKFAAIVTDWFLCSDQWLSNMRRYFHLHPSQEPRKMLATLYAPAQPQLLSCIAVGRAWEGFRTSGQHARRSILCDPRSRAGSRCLAKAPKKPPAHRAAHRDHRTQAASDQQSARELPRNRTPEARRRFRWKYRPMHGPPKLSDLARTAMDCLEKWSVGLNA